MSLMSLLYVRGDNMKFVLITSLYAAMGNPLIAQAMDSRAACEVVAQANRRLPQVAWSRCLPVLSPVE